MSDFATALELETHLQRTVSPEVAALALAGASGLVRSYCGWGLEREEITFSANGDGSDVLTLPTLRLADVTEVRIDDQVVADGTWLFHGQIILRTGWPLDSKIEVDVEHGYLPIPDVVRLVTLTVAARIINNPDDVKSATVGSVARTYDTTLSALELRLLDRYRL